jgi:hypothetical protein
MRQRVCAYRDLDTDIVMSIKGADEYSIDVKILMAAVSFKFWIFKFYFQIWRPENEGWRPGGLAPCRNAA